MSFAYKGNNMTFTRVATFAVAVSLGSLSGCAVFRGSELPEVEKLPAPSVAAQKPAASYQFTSAVNMGSKQPQHENLRAKLETEFADALRESGHFATVEKGTGKDVSISVELVESSNPAAIAAAFITGLSLYTIPSWATVEYEATCRATTADGRTREYKLKDSATLVQWLPMMVVFPFKPFSEIEEVRKNMYRNLIVRMQDDGVLPMAGRAVKTGRIEIRFDSPAT